MKRKSRGSQNRSVLKPAASAKPDLTTPLSVLADRHMRQIADAHAASPVDVSAPYGTVQRVVRLSEGNPMTAEQHKRMQEEKKGFDPGLGRRFETAAQNREYRKQHGIVTLSASEFNSEFGHGAPSLASQPAYSGGGMISRYKKFDPPDYGSVPGMSPSEVKQMVQSGRLAGSTQQLSRNVPESMLRE